MVLKHLQLIQFRNYQDISIDIPSEGALFEGLNGSGKTNLLEAIYLLCTGRSQRNASRMDMIKFGAESAFVNGVFDCGEHAPICASMGFSREKKIVLKLNDVSIRSFSEWFGDRAIVSFGAEDLTLVYGAPECRRRFLDLLISQIDREYLNALLLYRKCMAQRNILFLGRYDKNQLEIYEEQMAETGAAIISKRQEIVAILGPLLTEFYSEISGKSERAEIYYRSSILCDYSSKNEWKNVFLKVLNERREKDIAMGYSTAGPHRDDIRFLLDKKPARSFGSQGQCRSVALSLKLSSVGCIEQFRSGGMLFLIDDAVSELDPQRTSRVYPLIERKGQVFIATPSVDFPLRESILRFRISNGTAVIGH